MSLMSVTINDRGNPHRLRHVHDVHELLVVDSGVGRQLLDEDELPCNSGETWFFPAGVPHMSYARPGQSFTVLVADSGGLERHPGSVDDLFQALLQVLPQGGPLPLRSASARQVRSYFRAAWQEWQQVAAGHQACAIAHVVQAVAVMVRDCSQLAPLREAAAAERHLDLAIDYINRNYMLPLTIADLLPLGCLGRTRFLERFTQYTGQSVGGYLTATRLRQAECLLRQGQPLVEVALSCGFAHQSHMSRHFRQAHGCPPGAWQRVNIATGETEQ
ncbi:MAG: AraC family transcriptional regulator [Planctomycetota bacterium]|nr:MAG: AraC family transcriptional regulator [Planctomycetota bacterium]